MLQGKVARRLYHDFVKELPIIDYHCHLPPDEIAADTTASENAVQRARAELRVLEQERAKIEKQRKSQLKDFETAKNDARRLLEKVTKKI